MNDNINNKVFFYTIIFTNIFFVLLIIQEIRTYSENLSFTNKIQLLEKDIQTLDENANYKNLEQTKNRYNKFSPNFNAENRLQDLLMFIEKSTQKNLLTIKDIQFPVSNETESISKVTLKGSIEDYYNFIVELESDKSLKEIINSQIQMESGFPVLYLEIRSYKF